MEKLRIESDANMARAEKAETEVKALKETISKQESSIQTLNNKVSLLAGDLERAEKRADEVRMRIFTSLSLYRANSLAQTKEGRI